MNKLALIICSLLCLASCGQKGPLYLPGPPPPVQQQETAKEPLR